MGVHTAAEDGRERAVHRGRSDTTLPGGTGDRLVIEMSTENLVSNENLLALTEVLENTELPINQ